jgi:hypothetical protein
MLRAAAIAAVLLLPGLTGTSIDAANQKPAQRVNPDAATLVEFKKRVDGYVELHKKLEATLPKLPAQTDPYQIDTHQRALSRLMQEARKGARQGELFTPAMQRLVRSLLVPMFGGPDGRQLRAEIFENEFKGTVKLAVNARYPDEIPISTVPPQVLAQLPKLPEELEYRFVQTNI